jgi:threonyl-tRNA synthetase
MAIKYINNKGEVTEGEFDISVLRHTTSHILAQAIKRIYPDAKLAIGPAIENGFYYDIDLDYKISQEDLVKVEEEMKKIIKENLKIETFSLNKDEAIKLMNEKNENYKVELINDLPEDSVLTFFKQGEFVDLCVGPHLLYTKAVKAFKLFNVTGAYWRGDEKNKMLQRIYGTAFASKEELANHLEMLEEAKKRDHRKLGKELDLFMMSEEGPGFPFFLPKGMVLRNILENFWKAEHVKAGYQEIKTPMILNEQLWHRSGHWDHYKENMYFVNIDDENYAIKPMSCPGGMIVYKRKLTSYKDLPLRVAELGVVHRHELSGALHGLMRVRCFTQDDAHIYMTKEQIKDEVVGVIKLIDKIYTIFGFEYHIELSTKPDNSMGSDQDWEIATNALKEALKSIGRDYVLNEGDGAFYGPKLDFQLKDSIGRQWQCGTIQLDFQMPEKFDLTYIGADGSKHRPVMIHRTILGSIERFIGVITEHYAGAFPLWISPVQVKILPISQMQNEYACKIQEILKEKGFRVEVDLEDEKIGYKIRNAQLEKVPYMLVLGQNEVDSDTISFRKRDGEQKDKLTIQEFIQILEKEINLSLKKEG